jgi:hypothetical protein
VQVEYRLEEDPDLAPYTAGRPEPYPIEVFKLESTRRTVRVRDMRITLPTHTFSNDERRRFKSRRSHHEYHTPGNL